MANVQGIGVIKMIKNRIEILMKIMLLIGILLLSFEWIMVIDSLIKYK